ncbi:MAG: pyridoxamine 5'-phosphate oxidase family protein [Sphingomonadales bacterium]|jgi:predicted pyridoxine 5'-phosphate oxidase superfamily flavin-nucleotide-binding protein
MRAFTKFAFTDGVRQVQEEMGAADMMARFADSPREYKTITQAEASFILSRNSFYMASVTETGWPYIQHRGGPRGFLKPLGDNMLGFADFSGNKQYLTRGNLRANPRVHLFLTDYANARRLKIWAVAQESRDPRILAELIHDDYPAKVEAAILMRVEAFDWNCNQHIPRLVKG